MSCREAATRLGISTDEIEAMVERSGLKSVMAGWTRMVPTWRGCAAPADARFQDDLRPAGSGVRWDARSTT